MLELKRIGLATNLENWRPQGFRVRFSGVPLGNVFLLKGVTDEKNSLINRPGRNCSGLLE
jgi:hypothetical protein